MIRKKTSVFILRLIHGLFALYFIVCLLILYYNVFVLKLNFYFYLATVSLFLEGVAVFILNKGDCPLIHIQKRLGDDVPFFNLIFPKPLAKKAVPFFALITILAVILLIIRMVLK
jgi:hypothetical protein